MKPLFLFMRFLQIANKMPLLFFPTTVKEISNTIDQLKNSSPGPDNIGLVKTLPSISQVLLHPINSSLTTGIFPESWKTAKIQPIFKCGDQRDIDNYRQVSFLSAFSRSL